MVNKIKSFSFFSIKQIIELIWTTYIKRAENTDLIYSRFLILHFLEKGYRVKNSGEMFIVENYDGLNICIRKTGSDGLVFKQVFFENEYSAVVNFIQQNQLIIKNVVDCGANVGYTTLFLSNYFKNAEFICVEPDKENYQMIVNNVQFNHLGESVKAINMGIWSHAAKLKINSNFRDGKNWSFSLEEVQNTLEADTEAISIADVINTYHLETIDLLKIDIEGAERYIFSDVTKINFLSKVKCLAIEIHDEYEIRATIYAVLAHWGFEWIESGELTIAIKK